ncbi:hypothetical protein THRCLA_23329 [Thraustotheca clavata]|uniref:Secreted protein n=1 Tax=Thraustotheca clavata TaxID=74557 RepID=A0A1V9Y7K1_9STRA|nr:hypothetical protein THRCLA_23329 [Thraustotheca clavata]
MNALSVLCLLVALDGAAAVKSYDGKRTLTKTSCKELNCPHGGCLFENCKLSVSCTGGACEFKECVNPICQGGLCTFIASNGAKCPGGVCAFVDVKESFEEDYCTGGTCTLNDKPHPSSFSASLSE